MAEFTTQCPHCKAKLQVQDEWVGMEVECPLCRKIFAINKSSVQVETEKTEAVIKSSLAADEKNCPFCGGVIKEQAFFCKHCKTDLNKTTAQEQKQVESLFIFICPECDTVAELPEVLKNKEYECQCCCETSIARETVERNCPFCGEKIKIKATICKHCKQKVQSITPVSKKENKNFLQNSMQAVNHNANNGFQKLVDKTKAVKNQFNSSSYQSVASVEQEKSKASLVLGIINCLTWLLPIAGIPIGIIGLVMGCKKRYTAGIILNAITLVASVINSIVGAILWSGRF